MNCIFQFVKRLVCTPDIEDGKTALRSAILNKIQKSARSHIRKRLYAIQKVRSARLGEGIAMLYCIAILHRWFCMIIGPPSGWKEGQLTKKL